MPKTSQGQDEAGAEAGAGQSSKLSKETEWDIDAWRKFGFTPYSKSDVKRKAEFKGNLTKAVQSRKLPASAASRPKAQAPKKRATAAAGSKRSGGGGGGNEGKKRKTTAVLLTPLDLLRKSLTMVRKAVYPKTYVPGHCCFEAMTLSNPATAGVGDKCGAAITRDRFGRAYADPVVSRILLSRNAHGSCATLGPEHRQKLVAEYGEAAVATRDDEWERFYYEKRSEMMLQIDCQKTTSNLWHYNNDSDFLAFPFIFYRDLIVIGKVVSPEKYFFTTYTTRVDPTQLACWGHEQEFGENTTVEEAYDAESKFCSSFKVACLSFEGMF